MEKYFEGRRCELHRQNQPIRMKDLSMHIFQNMPSRCGKHRHGALSIERGTEEIDFVVHSQEPLMIYADGMKENFQGNHLKANAVMKKEFPCSIRKIHNILDGGFVYAILFVGLFIFFRRHRIFVQSCIPAEAKVVNSEDELSEYLTWVCLGAKARLLGTTLKCMYNQEGSNYRRKNPTIWAENVRCQHSSRKCCSLQNQCDVDWIVSQRTTYL